MAPGPDFRAFLVPHEPVVLPYLGGSRVDGVDRTWRVAVDAEAQLARGWWRFRVDGRRAVPLERAEPPAAVIAALPRVRGHWVAGWLAAERGALVPVALPPDDEPPTLARASARRWHSGDQLFDQLDFDDDAEVAARRALEELRPLGDVRGVAPSLRVAFGIALARALGAYLTPPELAPRALAIAEHGRPAVAELLAEIVEQLRLADEAAARRRAARRVATTAGTAREIPRAGDAAQRADDALAHANARLLASRALDAGRQLEVTYDVDGTRIISCIDAETLRVYDPGICIHDDDRELALDAMPSVVREAVRDERLVITRRA